MAGGGLLVFVIPLVLFLAVQRGSYDEHGWPGFVYYLLFFIPGTAQQQMGNPMPMFTGFAAEVVAMSVLFTWTYANTARSIWGAILFHMALNYTSNLLLMVTGGTIGLAVRLTGTAGLVALAIIVAMAYGVNLKRGQHE